MNTVQKALIHLDEEEFTPEILNKIKMGGYALAFGEKTYENIKRTREAFDSITKNSDIKYSGVNAGLGFLSEVEVKAEDIHQLQYNIIRSHSVGVGEPLSPEQVRQLFCTRIRVLSQGYSGITVDTFKKYVEAFNQDILPYIPCQGSVGASGDLAPLAHIALGLMGEGKIYDVNGQGFKDAKEILASKGYEPLKLQQKEGLSLINGAQFIASMAASALLQAENLAKHADLIFSVSFEALNGVQNAMHPKIHEIRNHAGQQEVAGRVRSLVNEDGKPSEMNNELKKKLNRVQDGYSIRCVPQVHGITHDTLKFLRKLIQNEINAVSDNPMIMTQKDGAEFSNPSLVQCGNFHGEYGAKSMDYMAIAVQELANISERRIERLVNPSLSKLPPFLTENAGKNCGFMMAHVTSVALTSENKSLCHPSSIDSIPTSANKEDHVSMGGYAARKCLQVIKNVERVLAIELLLACQALDFNRPFKSTEKIEKIHETVRQYIPFQKDDQHLSSNIDISHNLLKSGKLLEIANFQI